MSVNLLSFCFLPVLEHRSNKQGSQRPEGKAK